MPGSGQISVFVWVEGKLRVGVAVTTSCGVIETDA